MPRLFFTAVLLLLTATRALAQEAPQDSPAVLTLTAAIAEAQQNNRSIKISIQGVLYANDAILAAKTQRYPQFNVQLIGSGLLQAINVNIPQNALGTVNGSQVPAKDTVITTEPKFSALAFIQAYQPLSQLYSAHLNIQLMKVGKQLSEEQLRQQRQQITNSVKEAYYGLLQSQSALDAAQENFKAQQEVDRTTEQDTLETQKENLNDLMGRDIRTEFRLGGVPEAVPEEQNLELARKTALANRTEIRQAQFKIDQAMYSRRLQKAQYIPEVGIQYLFFSPFSIQGFPSAVNSLGISLKWDVYDWGYKRHLMDEKQRNIEQSQLNLTETQSQVVIDLDNRFRKLREARAGLKVAQLGQEAEKQKLQVVMEQYKQKAALLSTLQTEQANMAQAEAQYQQALSTFWSARSEFDKSLGED
jgi:outer membrane protein